MSEIIERHKELSRKVLAPDEQKSLKQETSRQMKLVPAQILYAFSLGAIVGFSIFVVILIASGFSKFAVMLPFIGGIFGVAVKMIWQKNK